MFLTDNRISKRWYKDELAKNDKRIRINTCTSVREQALTLVKCLSLSIVVSWVKDGLWLPFYCLVETNG